MPTSENRIVTITGAGSGWVKPMPFCSQPVETMSYSVLRQDRLDVVATQIDASGGTVDHAHTDVRRKADLDELVKLTFDRFGRVDVLVNNAGVMPVGRLDDLHVYD